MWINGQVPIISSTSKNLCSGYCLQVIPCAKFAASCQSIRKPFTTISTISPAVVVANWQ
ncbi:Uncharacterised protein [Vibrio cholerae]|nr:Uncharacterised protein [Vibrio cholerae]CSB69933.1 Uncharacterised protein [Vibrio cholerae]